MLPSRLFLPSVKKKMDGLESLRSAAPVWVILIGNKKVVPSEFSDMLYWRAAPAATVSLHV